MSVGLSLPWGPAVREEMLHLVSRAVEGAPVEEGVSVSVSGEGDCVWPGSAPPLPLSPPQTHLMKSSWTEGGSEGGREGGGWEGGGGRGRAGGSPEPWPLGTATDSNSLCSTWRDTLCAEELVSPGAPASLGESGVSWSSGGWRECFRGLL